MVCPVHGAAISANATEGNHKAVVCDALRKAHDTVCAEDLVAPARLALCGRQLLPTGYFGDNAQRKDPPSLRNLTQFRILE